MEHHEPTSNVPTDASERRITTPIPVAPAILMAAVLAATTALLLCVWLFTDIGAGHLLEAVILGLGLPLLTIGALFYYSALARRLHVYSEGKHADRQSEHAEILAEVRALQAELAGLREGQAHIMEALSRLAPGTVPVAVAEDIGLLRARMDLLRTDHDELSEEVGRMRRSAGVST